MKLLGFLSEDAVLLDMNASTKEEAIRELIKVVVDAGELEPGKSEAVFKQVLEREARGSTGLGGGLAIPHVKDCPHVKGLTGAFGRSEGGIPFDAVDGNPVHLVFLILGGGGSTPQHLEVLKKLAALRLNEHFVRFLRDAKDASAATDTIKEMAGSIA